MMKPCITKLLVTEAVLARFWANVDRETTPDGCWPWTACLDDKGYGLIRLQGRLWRGHRLSFLIAKGDPPEDAPHVLHSCHNPACCRPDHLHHGTHQDNMREREERGYHRERTGRGITHGCAKLTEERVREIRALHGLMSQPAIARQFKMSQSQINNILLRKQWAHLA